MEQDAYYFRVGLFVALITVVAIIVIGAFASKHESTGHIPYAIYVGGAVDGLAQGSPVKLRGIQVGYVDNIAFASIDGREDAIRVVVQVLDTAPVNASTMASLQMLGLTGGSMIALENSTGAKTPITNKDPEGLPIIASRPSSLERVFTGVPQLIEEITRLAVQGQKMLNDDNVKAVHDSLASVNGTVQALGKLIGGQKGDAMIGTFEQLNEMIGEAKITLREMRMLARTLREDPSIVIHGVQHEGVKVP